LLISQAGATKPREPADAGGDAARRFGDGEIAELAFAAGVVMAAQVVHQTVRHAVVLVRIPVQRDLVAGRAAMAQPLSERGRRGFAVIARHRQQRERHGRHVGDRLHHAFACSQRRRCHVVQHHAQ
jgi:hypothetical protein